MVRGSLVAVSVESSLSLQRAGASFLVVVVGLICICHRVAPLSVQCPEASSLIVASGFSRVAAESSSRIVAEDSGLLWSCSGASSRVVMGGLCRGVLFVARGSSLILAGLLLSSCEGLLSSYFRGLISMCG